MKWLTNLFTAIGHIFSSPKVQQAEQEIASLLPVAIGIVQEIDQAASNRTLEQINAIATKYAVPTVQALADGQNTGNVLLNLATEILQKNHAPTAAVSLLNTVVSLAVTAVRNSQ